MLSVTPSRQRQFGASATVSLAVLVLTVACGDDPAATFAPDVEPDVPLTRDDDRHRDTGDRGAADAGDAGPADAEDDRGASSDGDAAPDEPTADTTTSDTGAADTGGTDAGSDGGAEIGPLVAHIEVADPLPVSGVETTLDGRGSDGGGATIESWAWRVGPVGGATEDLTGDHVTYAFPDFGEQAIFLTVTDDRGRIHTATMELRVGALPVPSIVVPESPVAGAAASIGGGDSSDPDGEVVEWRWNFGDGSEGAGAGVEHTWAEPGSYDLRLFVVDDDGLEAEAIETLDVLDPADLNEPPTVEIGPDRDVAVDANTTWTADVTDDGVVTDHRWNFGDGSAEVEGVTVDHTWTTGGEYTVRVVVRDEFGATGADEALVTVHAENRAPEPRIDYLPHPARSGVSIRFDGSRSADPDGDAIVAWRWDFGDGSTDTGEITTHRFEAEGTFTVSLEVEDDRGSVGSTEIALDVECGAGCYGGTWRVRWGDSETVQEVGCGATRLTFGPADCEMERDGGALTMTCGPDRYFGTVDASGFDITLEVRPATTEWCGDVWFEERIVGELVTDDRWEGVSDIAFRVATPSGGCFNCGFEPVLKTGTRIPGD